MEMWNYEGSLEEILSNYKKMRGNYSNMLPDDYRYFDLETAITDVNKASRVILDYAEGLKQFYKNLTKSEKQTLMSLILTDPDL